MICSVCENEVMTRMNPESIATVFKPAILRTDRTFESHGEIIKFSNLEQ